MARCIGASVGGTGTGVNGGLIPTVELGRGSQASSSKRRLASALAGVDDDCGLLTRGVLDLADSDGLVMAERSTEAGMFLVVCVGGRPRRTVLFLSTPRGPVKRLGAEAGEEPDDCLESSSSWSC